MKDAAISKSERKKSRVQKFFAGAPRSLARKLPETLHPPLRFVAYHGKLLPMPPGYRDWLVRFTARKSRVAELKQNRKKVLTEKKRQRELAKKNRESAAADRKRQRELARKNHETVNLEMKRQRDFIETKKNKRLDRPPPEMRVDEMAGSPKGLYRRFVRETLKKLALRMPVSWHPALRWIDQKITGAVSPVKTITAKKGWAPAKGKSGAVDDAANTRGWPKDLVVSPAPYVRGERSRIKVLYLNSMGGSMGRLSKALMLHEDIEGDCMINAYTPRRHLLYPHETNANGVLDQKEWREYLTWAVNYYDVIQSSTLPLKSELAECYDWLTERMGRRHIWRTTGFIHHYLKREDVLPVSTYQQDLETLNQPGSWPFHMRTFKLTKKFIKTDPQIVFYSSPEKGAYLKGADNHWLPSIRNPDDFSPAKSRKRSIETPIFIYVPYHKKAIWKGLDEIIQCLEEIRDEDGYNIVIVTAENAGQLFPDLAAFEVAGANNTRGAGYPIPNHMMPELFRRVDIVVDQIVMGCYGNTGIEAMFCGKPVIGQKRYDEVHDAPVIHVEEDTMREEILKLLDNPSSWAKLGKQGREYAMAKHSPQAVAKIAADIYRKVMDEERH